MQQNAIHFIGTWDPPSIQQKRDLLCNRVFSMCAVLMKKVVQVKVHDLVTQGWKKSNSSKNDRLKYEIIGETQPEMK